MAHPPSPPAAAAVPATRAVPIRQVAGLGLLVGAALLLPAAVRAQVSAEALHAALCLPIGAGTSAAVPAGAPVLFAGHCALCWQALGLAVSGAVLALMPGGRDERAQVRTPAPVR